MTPEKLREKGNRWRELGQYDLANIYNQHAAALEEIERLKGDIRQMVEKEADEHLAGYRELGAKCAALEERAEKAERRAERLKVHAEAMAPTVMLDPLRIIGDRLMAHYGDRFCLSRPTIHTNNERQVLVAALKALRAGLAYRAEFKGE